MERPADVVIAKFGGLTKLAKALGHTHPSTVQGWKARGFIPARQMGEVLAAARRDGVDVSEADFIGEANDPAEPQRAAS